MDTEKYVKTKLPDFLEKHFNGDTQQYSLFFGSYATDPTQFEFSRGEIKIIKLMVAQIKSMADNDGLQSFRCTNFKNLVQMMKSKLCDTPIGPFFSNRKEIDASNQIFDLEKEKKDLIAKVHKKNEKVKDVLRKTEFSPDSIKVWVESGINLKGSILCCLCGSGRKHKESKVYYQRSLHSGYWVLSNYDTHIHRHHNKLQENKDKNLLVEPNRQKTTPINIANVPETNVEQHEDAASGESQNGESRNEELQSYEDGIKTQIFKQSINMINFTLAKKEDIRIFISQSPMKLPQKKVQICTIEGDGNCLYAAIAHQLFGDKINSPQHKRHTAELRAEVVDHIKNNFEQYLHDLKGRIFEKTNSAKNVDLKSDCLSFLNDLSKPGTWGGSESLAAITNIKCVNIIILNEDGSCDTANKFSLSSSDSSSDFATTGRKNHYDSVANITESLITKYTNDLTDVIKKCMDHKDTQANNVAILIE